jgi:hypothetical protein
MKKVLLLLFLASACLAKSKPRPYDYIGKLFYHPGEVRSIRNAIEGRTDLYYVDDYVCIPGDEHNAPTCRQANDWYVPTGIPDVPGYVEIFVDDSVTPAKPSVLPCSISGPGSDAVVCREVKGESGREFRKSMNMGEAGQRPSWLKPSGKNTWIFHYR